MFNLKNLYKQDLYLAPFKTFFKLCVVLTYIFVFNHPSEIHAFPARSTQVEEKGFIAVESPLPWISGWDLSHQATNVKSLLQSKAQLGYKGAYLLLCATWEAKCSKTLKFINRQRGQLIESEINIIAIFTENISAKDLSKWLADRDLTPHEHLSILIDRYHRSAIRTGAFEEEKGVNQPSADQEKDQEKDQESPTQAVEMVKRLRLPLGIIVSSDGTVLSIINQTGTDLVKIITQTVRYAGAE